MTAITAPICYLAQDVECPTFVIHPPSSGRPIDEPPMTQHVVSITDCRTLETPPDLDTYGFALLDGTGMAAVDYLDAAAVRARLYPAIEALIRAALGAEAVFAFDHNVRSVARAAQGASGVNAPVPQAHGDYTRDSGVRRMHEVLAERDAAHLGDHPYALINAWCPLRGPVLDVPLAVCDARSVAAGDLIDTTIDHFAEGSATQPSHSGHIYSLRYNPAHHWYYASAMCPGEVLLLKCFDSLEDGVARFAPHAAFRHPACPAVFEPRESIEVRTLAIYPGARRSLHAH